MRAVSLDVKPSRRTAKGYFFACMVGNRSTAARAAMLNLTRIADAGKRIRRTIRRRIHSRAPDSLPRRSPLPSGLSGEVPTSARAQGQRRAGQARRVAVRGGASRALRISFLRVSMLFSALFRAFDLVLDTAVEMREKAQKRAKRSIEMRTKEIRTLTRPPHLFLEVVGVARACGQDEPEEIAARAIRACLIEQRGATSRPVPESGHSDQRNAGNRPRPRRSR